MSSKLLKLCEKIVAYSKAGDPVKDIIDAESEYTEDQLLVELASHYVAANGGKKEHGHEG